jgi:predicted ATPase
MDSSGQGPRSLTALIGDNGSGKTTLLQAIALTLSMATRRTPDMALFDWHGFLPERVPLLGPTRVDLDVVFNPEEVAVTEELFAAPKVGNFYFLIERDGRVYDLAEMSSGEQAVFPLIYEFVRLDIRRSIVLIDELELHLHPPEQQRVLAALPKIGGDCQFFITTHSEFLTSTIPADRIVRLEKGLRCL